MADCEWSVDPRYASQDATELVVDPSGEGRLEKLMLVKKDPAFLVLELSALIASLE